MPRRSFLPPAVCDICKKRPAVGHTLWHSGVAWFCPACLTADKPGNDTVSKVATEIVNAARTQVLSRRAKVAGEIQEAADYENASNWYGGAVDSLNDHGQQLAKKNMVVNGEAVAPNSSYWLKDTLVNPELPALDSSITRTNLLLRTDILALALDLSNTIGAANSVEKILCHEIALAHKNAFDQANWALTSRDPAIELKRLHLSAKMMRVAQQGILALQKIKTGGTQNVVVQHVHVAEGGQAVIGAVQMGGRGGSGDSGEE